VFAPTTTAARNPTAAASSKSKLSGGAIAGILIGVILGVILIGVVGYYARRSLTRRGKRDVMLQSFLKEDQSDSELPY
jgi:hypothetical protein